MCFIAKSEAHKKEEPFERDNALAAIQALSEVLGDLRAEAAQPPSPQRNAFGEEAKQIIQARTSINSSNTLNFISYVISVLIFVFRTFWSSSTALHFPMPRRLSATPRRLHAPPIAVTNPYHTRFSSFTRISVAISSPAIVCVGC